MLPCSVGMESGLPVGGDLSTLLATLGPHISLERNAELGQDAWSWMEFIAPKAP